MSGEMVQEAFSPKCFPNVGVWGSFLKRRVDRVSNQTARVVLWSVNGTVASVSSGLSCGLGAEGSELVQWKLDVLNFAYPAWLVAACVIRQDDGRTWMACQETNVKTKLVFLEECYKLCILIWKKWKSMTLLLFWMNFFQWERDVFANWWSCSKDLRTEHCEHTRVIYNKLKMCL